MAVIYTVDPDSGIVRYTASGVVTGADMIAAMRGAFTDPRYRGPTRSLWDMTESTDILAGEDMQTIVEFVAEHRPAIPGKVAIVAPSPLAFGMGRMFQQMSDDHDVTKGTLDVRVFSDGTEAMDWLGEPR